MAKDLFSGQAAGYAKFRPVYPQELYSYILSFVEKRQTAWDCATGNGQAALELAKTFHKVYATDISKKQLDQAPKHERIEYAVAAAEESGFSDHIFDLITVAQAYHWFNFDHFRHEVERVARSGAIIAVWGYGLVECAQEDLDAAILRFYKQVVGPYWDAERKYVDDHYTTIPFPYEELPSQAFTIDTRWTKDELTGYLRTWSAVQHFMAAKGFDPVTEFARETERLWKNDQPVQFSFPLFLRLGKVLSRT